MNTTHNPNNKILSSPSSFLNKGDNTLEKAAIASKTIATPPHLRTTDLSQGGINSYQVANAERQIRNSITEIEYIFKLFPELKQVTKIVIHGITAPTDANTTTLNYSLKDIDLPPNVTQAITNVIKEAFDGHYKVAEKIPDWFNEALFLKGALVQIILPESSIDAMISTASSNSSKIGLESLNGVLFDFKGIGANREANLKPLGYLGNYNSEKDLPKRVGLESYFNPYANHSHYDPEVTKMIKYKGFIHPTIHDNFLALKLPEVLNYNASLESYEKIQKLVRDSLSGDQTTNAFIRKVYKHPKTNVLHIQMVNTDQNNVRKSIGRPLILTASPNAIVTIHRPGDPTNHVAYLILLDQYGNIISPTTMARDIDGFNSRLSPTSQVNNAGFMTEEVKKGFGKCCDNMKELSDLPLIYNRLFDDELKQRFANGLVGTNITIGPTLEISRVMLARAMSGQQTRILYVPAELVGYIAYDFFDNGVGKSLLEDLKLLLSLRASMFLARIVGSVKNMIDTTTVNIKLSEDDDSPMETIEMAVGEFMKANQYSMPGGMLDPGDLFDWIRRIGVNFTFEGHPKLPDTALSFSSGSGIEHKMPDMDLDESLKKQTYMGLSTMPDLIDSSFSSEFATDSVLKNELISKTYAQMGTKLMVRVTDYIKKVIIADPIIQDSLINVIEDNLTEIIKDLPESDFSDDASKTSLVNTILQEVIHVLEVNISRPNKNNIDALMDAYNKQAEAYETVLNSYFGEDLFNEDITGLSSGKIKSLKEAYKSYFLRKWIAEQGLLPELSDLTANDENGNPIIDIGNDLNQHMSTGIKKLDEYLAGSLNSKIKGNRVITKFDELSGADSNTDTETTEENTTTEEDDGFSDDSFDNFEEETTEENGEEATDDTDTTTEPKEEVEDKDSTETKDDKKET